MNTKETKKLRNVINIKKEDVIAFIILFILTLVVCAAFLKPHYTSDTYKIIFDGYEYYSYDKFLREARPITAILTMLAGIVNLPIEIYMLVSFILAIVILVASVMSLYKIFRNAKQEISNIEKIIYILISYITIFNYLAIEHILFLEACIMSLGILLSILACKIIINKEKNAWTKAVLVLLVAVYCYQGSIAIFPMILLTYYAIIEPLKFKEYIKMTIKAAIIYGLLMFSTVLYTKIFFGGSRIQIGAAEIKILDLLSSCKVLVLDSLNVIPSFVHIAIFAITIIFILLLSKEKIKDKLITISKYLLIVLASIAICMMPKITGAGVLVEARMCIAYGSTIGISLLFMYKNILQQENQKLAKIIIYSLTVILFICTLMLYNALTIQNIQTTKADKEICEEIKRIIAEYEKETGIMVTKIGAVYTRDEDGYMENVIRTRAYNKRATSDWALRETVRYYLDRPLQLVGLTREQYAEYFKFKKWNEFSEEQVLIKRRYIIFLCILN